MKKTIITIFILSFIIFGCGESVTSSSGIDPNPNTEAVIINHTSTDINSIPESWIQEAKDTLHIAYGHTSHGSQIPDGMDNLDTFMGGEGLYTYNSTGTGDNLHLFEGSGYSSGDMELDCGYSGWDTETEEYLGDPDPDTGRGTNHPEINVIMWSWCGQVDEVDLTSHYLTPMSELESKYPGIVFIYMTGHLEGKGPEGSVNQANKQIRQFCIDNNKVLYDFADIESYDPDGNYYLDKNADDGCNYDSDNNGTLDSNWAVNWQNSHTEGVDWYNCSCAHSQPLNGNLKAYAAWYMFARLAGWEGND